MRIIGYMPTLDSVGRDNSGTIRKFSEKQMRGYFTKDDSLLRLISTVTLVASIACFIGVIMESAYISLLAPVGLSLLFIAFVTHTIVRFGLQVPTDEEYDAWVNDRARGCLLKALGKVGQDALPEDEIDRILRVRGFVLANTKAASKYRSQDLLSKIGKDGIRRYSINIYTFFHPVEHQLAVFLFDINAVNFRDHREQVQEYFFNDVVAATTEFEQDIITDEQGEHAYRTESFALRICDGNRISVTIRSLPLDYEEGLPTYDLPATNVEQTIAKLRFLLRSKKQ